MQDGMKGFWRMVSAAAVYCGCGRLAWPFSQSFSEQPCHLHRKSWLHNKAEHVVSGL